MQYIIHDIIKLPLADRLKVIEQVICSMRKDNSEKELLELLSNQIQAIPQ